MLMLYAELLITKLSWIPHHLQSYEVEYILAISIKLKLPSYIRTPQEAHTKIRSKNSLVAYSIKCVILLPIVDPILPPIN